VEIARDFVAAPGWHTLAGRVHEADGAVLYAEGRAEDAATALGRAVAAYRDASRPWAEAGALAVWASGALRAGDGAAAAQHARAAAAVYDSIGAAPHWRALVDQYQHGG
jgi:hypothetical protein